LSFLVTECSTVGFCAIGPAVMVYPDGNLVAQVQASDVPEIVQEHLVKGRVVERLALLKVPSEGKQDSTGIDSVDRADWEA